MPGLPTGRTVVLNGKGFNFSVASTGIELMRGLSGVTDLGPYHGMLFDFGCDFKAIMHPRGLKIDIEVAFITSEGEIVEIGSLLQDMYPNFLLYAPVPVRYVLEVPVGFFEQNSLKVGDKINL